MNKIFFCILFAGLVVLSVTSCDKNTEVVDKEVIPPTLAKFNTILAADTIKTYYVTSNNAPIKIPIGISNVSGQDRTVQLTYTSTTAVAGTQYNAPATLVFPAGKVLDSLTFTGLFTGFPSSSRIDTVKIEITGTEVPASSYKNRFYVIMRKYCDVTLAGIAGDYAHTMEGTYGPYTSSVINLTSTGPTTATGTLTNVYDDGITATNVVFNWTDPANFTVTIPEQNTGSIVSGYQRWIRTSAGHW
ncbi:MAG: hypothetical protein WDO16_20330 [Bacteroidota bacterium]